MLAILYMLQDAAVTSHGVASGGVRLQRRSAVLSGANRHKRSEYFVRFEVFTAVTMKNVVFWDVALCRSCVKQRSSETSVDVRPTQRHIQEHDIIHSEYLQVVT
jgi:hypothetical protein